MFVAQNFIRNLVNKYGKHPVSTDGGGTWYPYACKFLKLRHHLHSSFEKSIIEREREREREQFNIYKRTNRIF
jgi:putative transposase